MKKEDASVVKTTHSHREREIISCFRDFGSDFGLADTTDCICFQGLSFVCTKIYSSCAFNTFECDFKTYCMQF